MARRQDDSTVVSVRISAADLRRLNRVATVRRCDLSGLIREGVISVALPAWEAEMMRQEDLLHELVADGMRRLLGDALYARVQHFLAEQSAKEAEALLAAMRAGLDRAKPAGSPAPGAARGARGTRRARKGE